MTVISIGKIRYLYGLEPELARKLAVELEAKINSETLASYRGELYSKVLLDTIADDLRTIGSNLPDKFPQILDNPDGPRSIMLFPDDGLYH